MRLILLTCLLGLAAEILLKTAGKSRLEGNRLEGYDGTVMGLSG